MYDDEKNGTPFMDEDLIPKKRSDDDDTDDLLEDEDPFMGLADDAEIAGDLGIADGEDY